MAGRFIVFEGGDCSGKDTQIDWLRDNLPADKFTFTKEPGGTAIGQRIRDLLLADSSNNMFSETELLLFSASRAQLVREIIRPELAKEKHLIVNRFFLSTLAYQIYGREKLEQLPLLEKITSLALDGTFPDLYIFIDVPPEVALRRLSDRPDEKNRLDKEDLTFHQRVHQGYLEGLKNLPHIKIDGTKSVEEVREDIINGLIKFFPDDGFEHFFKIAEVN
ncbi:MAG TPA: dTMP kinase [Candidatus Vogelbacteria bacterium]|nr:dTMP kinase [Candidatus Vogelbacteria bacterium]